MKDYQSIILLKWCQQFILLLSKRTFWNMIVFLMIVRKDSSSLYNISFGMVHFNVWEEIFQMKIHDILWFYNEFSQEN